MYAAEPLQPLVAGATPPDRLRKLGASQLGEQRPRLVQRIRGDHPPCAIRRVSQSLQQILTPLVGRELDAVLIGTPLRDRERKVERVAAELLADARRQRFP